MCFRFIFPRQLLSKLVKWQHKNYFWFGPFVAILFPALFAKFSGEIFGWCVIYIQNRNCGVYFCCFQILGWFIHCWLNALFRPSSSNMVCKFFGTSLGMTPFHQEILSLRHPNGIRWYHYDRFIFDWHII